MIRRAIVLAVISATAGIAGTVSFQGTFSTDDQVNLFQLTLNSTTAVTIQSYGYAGGVMNSTLIPAGGFAPDFTLFALVGSDYQEAASDNGGHCGITSADPVTGNCDDPYIQTTLQAGTYYLGLSVWDNVPVTGLLADGYAQSGNSGFTCAEGGVSGQFCDVTDALYPSRSGGWAISFTDFSSVTSVPEPSTWWLVLPAGVWGMLLRRRRSN